MEMRISSSYTRGTHGNLSLPAHHLPASEDLQRMGKKKGGGGKEYGMHMSEEEEEGLEPLGDIPLEEKRGS